MFSAHEDVFARGPLRREIIPNCPVISGCHSLEPRSGHCPPISRLISCDYVWELRWSSSRWLKSNDTFEWNSLENDTICLYIHLVNSSVVLSSKRLELSLIELTVVPKQEGNHTQIIDHHRIVSLIDCCFLGSLTRSTKSVTRLGKFNFKSPNNAVSKTASPKNAVIYLFQNEFCIITFVFVVKITTRASQLAALLQIWETAT